MYPTTMLNVAVNYREHDIEMARVRPGRHDAGARRRPARRRPGTTSAPGIWERKRRRHALESVHVLEGAGAIVAEGETVRLPPGRDADRVGMRARRRDRQARERACAKRSAMDYVFGYTLENDMSDRGGRGDTRFGSDWLVTKNHDTFAPMGPFITPKEFIKDVGNTGMTFVAERRGAAGQARPRR